MIALPALVIVAIKLGDFAEVIPRGGFWLLLAAIALSLADGLLFRRGYSRDAG